MKAFVIGVKKGKKKKMKKERKRKLEEDSETGGFSNWFLLYFGIILGLVILFLVVPLLKHDTENCKSFPYIYIEHNNSIDPSKEDYKTIDSWKANITVPERSGLCMGSMVEIEQDSPYGFKYNTTKCDGDMIGEGYYNVKCRAFNIEKGTKSQSVCNILYDCEPSKDWIWYR